MAFNPVGGGTYTLNASIGSTDTSITLSSFLEPVSGTPYTMVLMNTDIAYGTIAPRTNSSEFISFTGITQNANGTATLTGVTRGLQKKSPFTTSATFKLPHAGQSVFILSDVPQIFAQYPSKTNTETVSGDWNFTGNVTFSNFPVTPSNSDASTTVKGVTKLSTAPASATEPIAAGTNDPRIPVAYAVDSVGTDAYAISPSPTISAYVAGQTFTFKAGTANTGAATLNVSGLGAKTIKKFGTLDLVTGDIVANQVIVVVYDGTNMQLQSGTTSAVPVVNVFTANTPIGDSTTQFDITNTVATTYRYTFDGTGTDPLISAVTFPIGTVVDIQAQNFTAGNIGLFTVTGSGANYFEITNASGAVESNKTIGTGYIVKGAVYTPSSAVKYITIEQVGAGGAGEGTTSSDSGGEGGASAGYSYKLLAKSVLAATINYVVGYHATGTNTTSTQVAGRTIFNHSSPLISTGGTGATTPGTSSGGDINITGQKGGGNASNSSGADIGGVGGSTLLGMGGAALNNTADGNVGTGYGSGGGGGLTTSTTDVLGGNGADGVIILTEYFN